MQALAVELRETLSDPTAVSLTCAAQSEPSLEDSDLFVTLTELPVDDGSWLSPDLLRSDGTREYPSSEDAGTWVLTE